MHPPSFRTSFRSLMATICLAALAFFAPGSAAASCSFEYLEDPAAYSPSGWAGLPSGGGYIVKGTASGQEVTICGQLRDFDGNVIFDFQPVSSTDPGNCVKVPGTTGTAPGFAILIDGLVFREFDAGVYEYWAEFWDTSTTPHTRVCSTASVKSEAVVVPTVF
ncbi:MAG: hypothetical protein MI919_07960 [Holophagales bacterium]|nr:hypothetical protein [Holophagales bacterium]